MPYAGERAVLATKHGKLDCIAPSLAKVGLMVEVAGVDTDVLGTFTGKVPRTAPPLETAIVKARLGMAAAGLPFGLASEEASHRIPPCPLHACVLAKLARSVRSASEDAVTDRFHPV